mmetsp:Transcript_7650/g.16460  ORF Transcript_7650/g.16460 Transcript_7650/m.16460 type:complete len:294 (-) Transcript_7650:66-947(-)
MRFFVSALAWAAGFELIDVDAGKPVNPKFVIPGKWLSDKDHKFLFLPLTKPVEMSAKSARVFTNGDNLLVTVTEQAVEEEDSRSVKKFKLVLEALKSEAGNDEALLQQKLQQWSATEEDVEVKALVDEAAAHLVTVVNNKGGKASSSAHSTNVPLGGADKNKPTSFLQRVIPTKVLTFVNSSKETVSDDGWSMASAAVQADTSVIKESFAIGVPYPPPAERVFVLTTKPDTLMICMPWLKKSLSAQGIATGGKAFQRVPVFDMTGSKVAGPNRVPQDLSEALQQHQKYAQEAR